MSPDKDPDALADQGDREANKLQKRSDKLAEDVEDVSQDWHRKRSDEGVPGAPPHDEEDEEGDQEEDSEQKDDENGSEDKQDSEADSDDDDESEDEDSKKDSGDE